MFGEEKGGDGDMLAGGWVQVGPKLVRPFSEILDEVGVTDRFIRNWLSLLCFLLQGMTPTGTQTAVMAYMLVRRSHVTL